jgi:hypothetical protein
MSMSMDAYSRWGFGLSDLTIVMKIPTSVEIEPMTAEPGANDTFDASKRIIVWKVPKLLCGESYNAQAMFEVIKHIQDVSALDFSLAVSGKFTQSSVVTDKCKKSHLGSEIEVTLRPDASYPMTLSVNLERQFYFTASSIP